MDQVVESIVIRIVIRILMLSLLGLTGFIAGRTKYLPDNAGSVLSRIVIKLTAPILIVCTMASKSFTARDFSNGIWIYGFGLFSPTYHQNKKALCRYQDR